MTFEQNIRNLALKNAIAYKGKANPKALVGSVLRDHAEWREKRDELTTIISDIVNEVNAMSLEEQQKELESAAPELLEKKERQEGLKPLPNAEEKKVVVRMAPSPSGPLHIGHAYVTSLNYEYSQMYKGKMFFRIEDTNPSNIYPPAYDLIPEDAKWLTDDGIVEFIIQSDRLNIYYEYAEKLFEKNAIYVCTCDAEEFRDLVKKSVPCGCRDLPPETQLKRWKSMFTEYSQGEAVVRFKSDINHKNPAMRDFPLFRINEEEHPRVGKKYRVWPLMNMSVAIDDLELGMTHTLRGKDHADNAKRQEMIHNVLDFKTPEAISVGRINFDGLEVSCSKTKEKIENGTYDAWDDIRLPFLRALKRRGFQPTALRRFAIEMGVSKTDKSVAAEDFFKTINAFNKELLDPNSNRYFFIKDPVKITIPDAPEIETELDLHPDNKKGGRSFATGTEFLIDKEDFDNIKEGQVCRLMDCLTFKKQGSTFTFISESYEDYKNIKENKGPIIHWLVDDELVDVQVRMPDNSLLIGKGEKWLNDIKEDDIIQLERFGFVRCDKITPDLTEFWFTHK